MSSRGVLRNPVQGFTLIELLTVVAIIAIVAAVAAPSFSRVLVKQQLNKSARELAAVLTTARSQAALLNVNTTVQLNSSAQDTNTTFNWAPSGGSLYQQTTPTSVIFLPNGTVSGISGTTTQIALKLCDSNRAKAITVTILLMGTLTQTGGTCS